MCNLMQGWCVFIAISDEDDDFMGLYDFSVIMLEPARFSDSGTRSTDQWRAEGKGNIRWCRTLRHDTSAMIM